MALPEHIYLEIVTAERRLYSGWVDQVTVPASQGYLGILPGHAPLLAELGIGEISFKRGYQTEHLFCSGGFLEVLPERVIVLAQTAELASEIDINRAQQAKLRAERRLSARDSGVDYHRAQLALLRAFSRLDAARRFRRRPAGF